METRNRLSRWATLTATALIMLAGLTASCSKSDDEPVPDVEVGETVKDFKKVKQYGGTVQFQNDLDALVTYAFDIRAVRFGYLMMASNGLINSEPFSATEDDMDNNPAFQVCAEWLYNVIDDIAGREEQYTEAIERLEDSGVLTRPTGSTRGMLSDAWDFAKECKMTQTMGRQSVITIMRQLGWTNDAMKLQQAYNDLPANVRRGYSNSQEFWHDFSAGKLDSRANQVFVNMYTYADPDFGDKARDLNITPGKNITVAGAKLIEKGAALVIDASPMSTQLGYGKDIYETAAAFGDMVSEGDVKKFAQKMVGNLINYGREGSKVWHKIKDYDINYWKGFDDFWDNFGKDLATVYTNDVAFGTIEYKGGAELIPNIVKTRDKNGEEISIVVMVDTRTGQTVIAYVVDKDGNVIAASNQPGTKTITVVNRQTGKRGTKTITVPEKGETEVEVELEFDENLLEENPKNGELTLSPGSIKDDSGEATSERVSIITNYLYYSSKTSDDWITASIASDANFLYLRLAKNDTGKERKGQVTVMATDSKGKVLKTKVLPITQAPYVEPEIGIKATPSSLTFDADGGKQSIYLDMPDGIKSWGVDTSDDMAGWASADPTIENEAYEVVVDVKKNDSDKERSGTVTIWCSYDETGAKADYKTTVLVKQAALDASDFAEMIIGKWYNASYRTGTSTIDNVIGFEFTKDGKYTWFDYNVTRTPGTTKLKRTGDSSDQWISGTYKVSGNKITFSRSSGGGYAYEDSNTWGYNKETTYVIEFENGKDIELGKNDVIPYNGKVLRLKKTDGKVPSTFNWPYYRNIWEFEDFDYSAVKSMSISWYLYYATGDSYSYTTESIDFKEGDIQASKSGNSLRVSAHRTYTYMGGEYDVSVSFTVAIIPEGGWGKMSSLKVDLTKEFKQYDNTIKVKFDADDVPHRDGSSTLWGATGDDLKVSNFTYVNGGNTLPLYSDKSGNSLQVSFSY